MTEFTSEFIAEQRTLAVALPKRLSVGVVHKNHVNINQNFDTKPIPTKLNVMDVNIFSTMPETCLTAQSICDACNHYPEALDHIEQLQARVQELEQGLKNKCANCGLAIPHGIWGDEDNDYDNLPKLPQDEE